MPGYRPQPGRLAGARLPLALAANDFPPLSLARISRMKPLSTSIYTFEKLISGGFLYVDKTAHIHRLLEPASAQYFLARPRRFGKSLLVSTLKVIFEGRRDLFEGLAIAKLPYDWKTHPVIHLDMGDCAADCGADLEQALRELVDAHAEEFSVPLHNAKASSRLRELIQKLCKRGERVVILVDEYDKPLLGHLGKKSVTGIQKVLKNFYSVIKTTEAQQRFVLLTGVSKFSKVSVFSDLNNLTDLTMQADAATLLGYTQEELEGCFVEYLKRLASALGWSRDKTLDELRIWYNGYRFHHAAPTVYNPVSAMKCLMEREFKNYWFETGTPSFLVELLKKKPVDFGNLIVSEAAFSTYEVDALEPLPLLVQTGYLTIQRMEMLGTRRQFQLGYPNREIEQSFADSLAQGYCSLPAEELNSALRRIIAALREDDIEAALEQMKIFFAAVPYDITLKNEKYYQTIFFVVFKLLGACIEAESRTGQGRIDAVVKTPGRIFILEFKLFGTAAEALAQIKAKRYYEPYLSDGRPVVLVGAAFDATTRNLEQWLVEEPYSY
ncbi:MAG: ATP-binding protein [Planctomycetes bacterium]|nr:ATP-binding protein [Planctomycetota bacterium]